MGAAQYNASESSCWVWIWMGGFESPLSGSWEPRVNLFLWMHTDHLWITYNSNFKTAYWNFLDVIIGPGCGCWGQFILILIFAFKRFGWSGSWTESSELMGTLRQFWGWWIHGIKNTNGILVQLAQYKASVAMGSNPFGAIHDCRFILCCDACQCKALQSKMIKQANLDLLGSFEYDKVCIQCTSTSSKTVCTMHLHSSI